MIPYKVDRTGWPPGPWDNEPDEAIFEHAGLPCRILRDTAGHLCGYVGAPPGHRGLDPDVCPEFRVHGGVNYRWVGQSRMLAAGWEWFGFDCGHIGDRTPRTVRGVYRDLEYVTAQTKGLAEQIAAVIKAASEAQETWNATAGPLLDRWQVVHTAAHRDPASYDGACPDGWTPAGPWEPMSVGYDHGVVTVVSWRRPLRRA